MKNPIFIEIANRSKIGVVFTLTLMLTTMFYGQAPNGSSNGNVDIPALLRHLGSVTKGQGIIIELHGTCIASEPELITVRPIHWANSMITGSLVDILQGNLRENLQLAIQQAAPTVVVVRDTGVSDALFTIKLKELSFTKAEQYSPDAALAALLNTDEVRAGLAKANMMMVSTVPGLQHVNPVGGLHLDRHVKDASVASVLTSILIRFGGTIVYEECTDSMGQRKFDLQYYK
jgi:hypothetical protein